MPRPLFVSIFEVQAAGTAAVLVGLRRGSRLGASALPRFARLTPPPPLRGLRPQGEGEPEVWGGGVSARSVAVGSLPARHASPPPAPSPWPAATGEGEPEMWGCGVNARSVAVGSLPARHASPPLPLLRGLPPL